MLCTNQQDVWTPRGGYYDMEFESPTKDSDAAWAADNFEDMMFDLADCGYW